MNLKEEGKNSTFASLLMGTNNEEIYYTLIIPTLAMWMIGSLIGIVVYSFGDPDPFVTSFTKPLQIAGSLGVILAVASFFFKSDWCKKDGWSIWMRIVIYNAIMVATCVWLGNTFVKTVVEPAKSIVFYHKSVSGCEHSVELKTENMQFVFCTSDKKELSPFTPKGLTINIVGTKSMDGYIPNHYAIIEQAYELNKQ